MLITAAEEEETAFRQLRDRWVPNNFVLFERVEEQRAQASRARREAEDRVIALREVLEEAPDPDKIAEFSRSLGLIRNDWLNLHGEYTVLRDGAEKRKTFDTLSGFDRIAKGMASMVASLGELPRLTGADETVDDLIEAAEDELKAFEAAGRTVEGRRKRALCPIVWIPELLYPVQSLLISLRSTAASLLVKLHSSGPSALWGASMTLMSPKPWRTSKSSAMSTPGYAWHGMLSTAVTTTGGKAPAGVSRLRSFERWSGSICALETSVGRYVTYRGLAACCPYTAYWPTL